MRSLLLGLLRRPVGIVVGASAVVLLGVIAYQRVPLQLFPDGIENRSLTIFVRLRQSSPQEAEREIAIPLEEELATVAGIESIRSRCDTRRVRVSVEFKKDVHVPTVEREIRDRVARVEARLPDGVDRVGIWRHGMSDMPVMRFAVAGVDDTREKRIELSDAVEDVVLPGLDALPGVARSSAWGLIRQSVRIYLDREEVARRGLDLRDLLRRLRQDNMAVDVGELTEAGRKSFIRADMEFRSLEEIRNFPVLEGLTLGEIATIEVIPALDTGLARFNGKPVISCNVYKGADANTVELCARVREHLERLKAEHPAIRPLEITPYFDTGEQIENAISTLVENALWGGVLAVFVLFLFFRRMRMTFLVAAAIPLSLTIAVTVLYLGGDSLNMLTMMGLTLAVGMLIDNAIVVVESILRRRELGDSPRDAARKGTSEVALAVLTATLTTIVVFLPVIFLSEDPNARIFLGSIGFPITYALLGSLAVALVLIPLGTMYLRRGDTAKEARSGPVIGGLRRAYAAVLWVALRRRFAVVLFSFLFLGFLMLNLERRSIGANTAVRMRVGFPRHYTMRDASNTMRIFESYVQQHLERFDLSGVFTRFDRRSAFLIVWQNPGASVPLDEAKDWLTENWPEVAGLKVRAAAFDAGGETRVALEGEDSGALERTLDLIRNRLELLPSVAEVSQEEEAGNDELRITLDPAAVERHDIDANVVRGVVGWVLRGARLRDYRTAGRDLPLLIEFDPSTTRDVKDLKEVRIPGATGAVPLSHVARIGVKGAPVQIRRQDGKRVAELLVRGKEGRLEALREEVMGAVRRTPLPPGVRLRTRGGWVDSDETIAALSKAFFLSVVLVFLLTGVLFEALLMPLAVVMAILPALPGSKLALLIAGKPIDELAYVGMIVLAGIVVNNAIVLLDRIQQHRRKGTPMRAAIQKAGRDRLRPVLMTALTTITGLIPMAIFGRGVEGGVPYDTLATAVIGGLTASTAVTLVLVPVVFTLLHDLGQAMRRAIGGVFWAARRTEAGEAPDAPSLRG